jgi:hypothetical protein
MPKIADRARLCFIKLVICTIRKILNFPQKGKRKME